MLLLLSLVQEFSDRCKLLRVAELGNFAGPFIFGTAIATTVGKGIIQPEFSTIPVIFAGLIGAIVWDIITWYFGLPSSSSHALIGGLIGSALVAGGIQAIVSEGVEKVLIFMVISPTLGFVISYAFTVLLMYFFRKSNSGKVDRIFGKLQIGSLFFTPLLMVQMMAKRQWV